MKLSKVLIIGFLFLNINITVAQKKDDNQSLRNIKTNIKNAFSLRDPFRRNIPISILEKSADHTLGQSNTEIALSNIPIKDIKIIGVLLGAKRRAIAQVASSKETYMLKEGMFIGSRKKKLEVILPGGVVLVEKTTNVYDEDEYLETIIPVSNAFKEKLKTQRRRR